MAAIDMSGYVADLKDHAAEHGFHIHDERHFVETYSLRQAWEVDLHPEEACGGPLDLHLTLEADPRTMLAFEDVLLAGAEGELPPDEFWAQLTFTWALPPLDNKPDLLVLATDLAGLGGQTLPIEVSAIDSFPSVTDAAQRTLTIIARFDLSLRGLLNGEDGMCVVLDRCNEICRDLLVRADTWYD
ncbi:MAG TPA: hypothetical protein EYG17_06385 [Acidimicrobiia bacterium]|jgi:hypothetical protein|nr:hypothetical protein [Acidimicrobiia bacterium]HIL05660.1 hypothetical protein [Acidimicrobiia bacterium]